MPVYSSFVCLLGIKFTFIHILYLYMIFIHESRMPVSSNQAFFEITDSREVLLDQFALEVTVIVAHCTAYDVLIWLCHFQKFQL